MGHPPLYQPSWHAGCGAPSLQTRCGGLLPNPVSHRLVSASSLSTQRSVSRRPSAKPAKLLRTWREGKRVLSTKRGPPRRRDLSQASEERELPSPLVLDEFYSVSEDEMENTRGDSEEEDYTDDDDHDDAADYDEDASVVDGHTLIPANTHTSDLLCEHFFRCSGCVLETALDQPPVFKDAERFFRCHGLHELKLTTGSVWEWRCKAKLAVRGTSKDPIIGLYREGSHEVVDIPNCRTHHPRINAAIELLKAGVRELGVQPYDEDSGTGELRYVQMSVTTYNTSIPVTERYTNGKVQVSLVWNARSEQSSSGEILSSLAQFLWAKGGSKSENPIIHSVWANFQTSRTNVIFGGRWRHLLGEQQCWERIGGLDAHLTPASFSQANLQGFESLLRKLQKFVKPGKAVVELYAGSGIIGLSLAVNCRSRIVRCVEINKEAAVPFQLTLSRLPSPIRSRVSWHCADVTVSPINWLKGFDIIVVDPPRKGLDPSIVDALRTVSLRGQGKSKPPSKEKLERIEKRPWILRAKQSGIQIGGSTLVGEESTWPDTLIYISCGWEAFKADCTDLVKDNSWHLMAAQAFNLFPGTDSIEVLAVFKRGKKVKDKRKNTLQQKKSSSFRGRSQVQSG